MLQAPKYNKGQKVLVEYDGSYLTATIESIHPKPHCVIYKCNIHAARKGFFEHGSTWFEEEIKPWEEACSVSSSCRSS
jgi:hypothetical protein